MSQQNSLNKWTARPSQRRPPDTPDTPGRTTNRSGNTQNAQNAQNRQNLQDTSSSDDQVPVTPDTSNLQFPAPSASQSLADCFNSEVMREAASRQLDIDALLADETPAANAQTPERKKASVFTRVSTTFHKATEKKKKKEPLVDEKSIVGSHSPSQSAPARPSKPSPQHATSSRKGPKPRVPVLQLGALGQAGTGSSTSRLESPGPQSPKRVTFEPEQAVASPRRPARTDLASLRVSDARQHIAEIDVLLADFANMPDTLGSTPVVPPADSARAGRTLTLNSFIKDAAPGVDTLSNEGLNQLIALLDVDAESDKQPGQHPEKPQ